jgi:hypothetical protein
MTLKLIFFIVIYNFIQMDKIQVVYSNLIFNIIFDNFDNYIFELYLSKLFKFMLNNNLSEIAIYNIILDKVYLIDSINFPEKLEDLEEYPVSYSCIENFFEDDDNFEEITRIIFSDNIIHNSKIVNYIIETNILENNLNNKMLNLNLNLEKDDNINDITNLMTNLNLEKKEKKIKKCKNCGEVGHYKNNCSMLNNKEDKKEKQIRRCKNCGEVGHYKNNCPN